MTSYSYSYSYSYSHSHSHTYSYSYSCSYNGFIPTYYLPWFRRFFSCRHLKPDPSGSAPHALHTWQGVAAAASRSLSQRIPSKPNLKSGVVWPLRGQLRTTLQLPGIEAKFDKPSFFRVPTWASSMGVTHKSPGHNTHVQDSSWSYPPYVPLEAMCETQKKPTIWGWFLPPIEMATWGWFVAVGLQTELLQARSARIRGVNAKDRGWRPTWPEEAENTNLMDHFMGV